MQMSEEEKEILSKLCDEYNVSFEKAKKLIEIEKKFEPMERRIGIYDDLKQVIRDKI